MAELEIGVLGPLTVAVDGCPVDLASRKQRALLALLGLRAGQVLSVDRIVDDLWGEHPPATARHALQVHVSNLRKVLGVATLGTERPGYVLRVPPESCDAARFESGTAAGRRALRAGRSGEAAETLSDALALWRGPALADLLFEPFAAQAAPRLEELRLAATEDRVVADLELGRHAELVGELEALVGLHPLRERLWGLLMLACYRSGRQAEALRAYSTLRERLREDLGLDPGPDLQQLEAAILRQEPSLSPPAVAPEQVASYGEATPPPEAAAPVKAPDSRRLATVVVAGLVGFDGLAQDPEDLNAALDRCMAALADVVVRYGGTIDDVVGSEVLAVFGAPVAHEDDPERAVRAALDLQRVLREQPQDLVGLELTVGICTGEVLFAASGPPAQRRLRVMGGVVRSARRLQAFAGADSVMVDRATYAATRTAVEFEASGPEAFVALDVALVKPARPLGRAPFLGRAGELDLLLRVWRRSITDRRPQLVSILGEPGVGKSRLVAELQRCVLAEGRVLSGRCLPYGEALSYAPLAEALRQAAGAAADDPAAVARERVGALVRACSAPAGKDEDDIARHLALMTGLDDERDRADGLVDERTLHSSTRRFLERLARDRPLCLVLDDVHWADDALLDLVQAVARRARGVPLVIVAVARTELVDRRSDWGGGLAAFTSLSLEPLDEASTQALVVELGKAHGQPGEVLAEIATKCGGNPLFAEELVATVAEGDAAMGVPASLTSLLLARLDALPAEQRLTLRQASVLGMSFWPGAVAALAAAVPTTPGAFATSASVADLSDTMADLEHRDLLRVEPRSGLAGHAEYSFKHMLIRDAAYGSLPRQQRKELHRAAGDWLRRVAGNRAAEFSDQLAHHALESGQPERALDHLLAAADRSRRAAAHAREAALLGEGLAVCESLGRHTLVGEVHARRGRALSRVARWPEARAELEAALAALPADTPDQLRRRAEVHCDLSTACFWLFDTDGIGEHARAALEVAEGIGARDVQLAARAQITNADSSLGDVDRVLSGGHDLIADAEAWELEPPYERLGTYSLQLYLTGNAERAVDVARRAVRTGQVSGDTQGALWNMPHMGIAAAAAGRYDEAVAIFEEGRRFGEEYELPGALTRCIAMSAGFHLDLFDYAGAQAIQEEACELGRAHFAPSAVSAGIDLMFTFTRRGDVGRAGSMYDDVAAAVMQGMGWHGWLWRLRLAQLQAEMALAYGRPAEAAGLATAAREQSRAKRRGKYEAYAGVTLARSLAATGRKQEALEELRSALGTARRLGNPALHAMVAAELLQLEPDRDVAVEARAVVDRVLASLSEPDVRHAFLAADQVRTITSA